MESPAARFVRRGSEARVALVALGAVLFLIGGCAAARQVRRGDEALEAGRHEQAYRHFQNAVARKPDLKTDPEFESKFAFARSRATYEQAQQLIAQEAYDQAVAKLEESVDADGAYQPAQAALERARGSAAAQLHHRALGLADEGKRSAAVEALNRALHHRAQHEGANEALASLETLTRTPAPASYAQGVRLARERFWQRALIEFDRAVAEAPNHLPSRLARYEARESLKRAADLHHRADDHLRAKRLPEAIAFAKQAVDVWPAHEQAQGVLASATEAQDRAGALLDESRALAAARRWDEAVEAVGASLAIYPYDSAAGALRDKTRQDAAADYAAAGEGALAAGRLGEAETAFGDALRFVADYRPAREGLARTSYQRGRLAHERDLPGNALLWYLDAKASASLTEIEQAIAAARRDLHARGAAVVRLAVADASRDGGAAAGRLGGYFGGYAAREAPPFVVVKDDAQADYEATLSLTSVDIQERQTRSERRSHRYVEEVPQPNPRIPMLRSQLHRAESELASIERQFHERCHACQGSGRGRCPHCHGRGEIRCVACAGRGHVFIGAERQACGRCGGRGHARCGRCSGGHIRCATCRGTGRRYPHIDAGDVSRARRRVSDLHRELSREPDTILVQYDRTWPYTLEHYVKTGALSATLALGDEQGATIGDDVTIPAEFQMVDQRVIGANPQVGLPPDELELPEDGLVMEDLTRQAGERAAAMVLDRVGRAVVAAQLERGRAMAQAGEDAQAVEANVSAALFMEAVDASEAEALWKQLRSP